MKKLLISSVLVVALVSCGNDANNSVTQSDTTGAKAPDGIVNSNVISTDTSAYKVDTNAAKKETGDKAK